MSKLINDEVRSEYTFPHLYSQAYVDEKQQEIERLNNIINEIQDMCREEYYKKNTTDIDSIGLSNNIWVMIYMKLKEIKENK